MRPDRILVGEVRGPEALDLLMALNTGHQGGFSTLHANNARSSTLPPPHSRLAARPSPFCSTPSQPAAAVRQRQRPAADEWVLRALRTSGTKEKTMAAKDSRHDLVAAARM